MKKRLCRTVALLLVLITVMLPFASCAPSLGEPLLTLKADGKTYTYSVNLYELYLSAIKGQLVASGATVKGVSAEYDAFWDTIDLLDGKNQTVNEYYLDMALEECKYATVALYLFDKYGLSLSEAEKEKIEQDVEELVKTDGNGSKNALNKVLSEYNVNYDIMREHYTNKTKLSAVQNYLYTRLGDNIKANYMKENYVHFHQIFLASYKYVYETDKNGDVIYFGADNKACYKSTPYSEVIGGVKVYYTDASHTKISYDEENGTPVPKTAADGSGYETLEMTQKELEALADRAALLTDELLGASETAFEAAVAKESDDETAVSTYTDGYYLMRNVDYSADWGNAYSLLLKKLEEMEIGEVACVKSDSGYHIIKKYEHTEKAYDKTENDVWFSDFASGLSLQIYREACEPYLDDIEIDEELLAEARDMKGVPVNFFYY